MPLHQFPGGLYRASSTATFPASTAISGGLVIQNAGGLRELHWHDPDEWAIVINGTCRVLMVDFSANRPSDSWDYKYGDVWYFPSNTAHSILGLGPNGCSYIVAYNDGAFDDAVNSQGLSNWVATAPPAIVSQV